MVKAAVEAVAGGTGATSVKPRELNGNKAGLATIDVTGGVEQPSRGAEGTSCPAVGTPDGTCSEFEEDVAI